MKIAFAGFRHSHIFSLYEMAKKSDKFEIAGCFEENKEAKAEAEKKGIVFNYNSYEEILADFRVDAVAIGDYYGVRGELAVRALEHGKHVICDKPICTDISELDKIEKLSEEKNLKVCCMLDLRYMAQVQKVKELIEGGEIGKIHIASFTGQHCLDYGNRPGWYFEAGKHGGTVNDIAIHGIDLLRYLTKSDVTKIDFVKTWNAFAAKEPDFKDCAQFMVKMGDINVMADVSYAAPKFDGMLSEYWQFNLWGEGGMIRFNYKDTALHIFKDKQTVIECGEGKINYLNDFADEINGIKTEIMDTKDILKSQRQVLEIQNRA